MKKLTILLLISLFGVVLIACNEDEGGNGDNQAPTAVASATVQTGTLNVSFSAEGSFDPDGSIVKWEWDFTGDGTFDFESTQSGDATHEYPEEGVYTAVLRVTDDGDATDTDEVVISLNMNGAIQGTVVDNTGAGVSFDTVIAVPTEEEENIIDILLMAASGQSGNYYAEITDSNGDYLIDDVVPQSYVLIAGFLNYADNLTLSFEADTTGLMSGNFSIDPDSLPLEEIVEVPESETVTHNLELIPAVQLLFDENGDSSSIVPWPITAGIILDPMPLPFDLEGNYTFMWEPYNLGTREVNGYAIGIHSLDEGNDWIWGWPTDSLDYFVNGTETYKEFDGMGWYPEDPETLVEIPSGKYKVSVAAILFDPFLGESGEVATEEFFSGYFKIE